MVASRSHSAWFCENKAARFEAAVPLGMQKSHSTSRLTPLDRAAKIRKKNKCKQGLHAAARPSAGSFIILWNGLHVTGRFYGCFKYVPLEDLRLWLEAATSLRRPVALPTTRIKLPQPANVQSSFLTLGYLAVEYSPILHAAWGCYLDWCY